MLRAGRRLRVFAESTAGGGKATVFCWSDSRQSLRFGAKADNAETPPPLFLGYKDGEIVLSTADFDLLAAQDKSYYRHVTGLCELFDTSCADSLSVDDSTETLLHFFKNAHLEKLIRFELVSPCEIKLEVKLNFPYGALRDKLRKFFSSEEKGHFLLKEKFSKSASIWCRACHDCVLDLTRSPSPVAGFHLMPHDDWRELVDCWSCHKDEFGHLAFKQYVYKPRQVYVGLDYFVFGAELLQSGQNGQKGRCACGRIAENTPINALHLSWAEKGASSESSLSSPSFSHLSGSLMLMLKIISMAKDNSSFRFVMVNKSKSAFLLIWVLSIDSWTLNTFKGSSLSASSSFEQTVKLWWKKCSSKSEYDPVEFEHLELTFEDQFEECLSYLQESTEDLPPSLRCSAINSFQLSCIRL